MQKIDKSIDKIWKETFQFLINYERLFCSSALESDPNKDINDIQIVSGDRLEFIKKVKEKDREEWVDNFLKILNSTKFYELLFRVARDDSAMKKIRYLEISIKTNRYYEHISSNETDHHIDFWFKSDSQSLKELGKYLYDGFLKKKGVKSYYFNNSDIKEQIRIAQEGQPCPYCGEYMVIVELDHFLPKSIYPMLSVYSENLIPSCDTCNDKLKKEDIYLPIVHPFRLNYLEYIKFEFSGYDVTIMAKHDDELKLPIENLLLTTKLKKIYNNKSKRAQLKLIDDCFQKDPFLTPKLYVASNLQLMPFIQRVFFNDYLVQFGDRERIVEDYNNFQN